MSRCCELMVVVDGYDDTKYEEIVDAVKDLGYDGYVDAIGSLIVFNSETINICAGRLDEEVASELHQAIWRANGDFCAVRVGMRDLEEDRPYFSGTKEEYAKYIAEGDSS